MATYFSSSGALEELIYRHMYTCLYSYTHIQYNTHTHTYIYIYICMYMYMYIYIYIYMYMQTYIHVVYMQYTCSTQYTYSTQTYIHTYIHTYIQYTKTHTHIHAGLKTGYRLSGTQLKKATGFRACWASAYFRCILAATNMTRTKNLTQLQARHV